MVSESGNGGFAVYSGRTGHNHLLRTCLPADTPWQYAVGEMPSSTSYDAVVVGAGPNGLSAAIVLAQAGKSVLVVEAKETVGGGMRSAELTLPGFVHDVCSTAYPLGAGSPFFNSLPLAEHGLRVGPPDCSGDPPARRWNDGRACIARCPRPPTDWPPTLRRTEGSWADWSKIGMKLSSTYYPRFDVCRGIPLPWRVLA